MCICFYYYQNQRFCPLRSAQWAPHELVFIGPAKSDAAERNGYNKSTIFYHETTGFVNMISAVFSAKTEDFQLFKKILKKLLTSGEFCAKMFIVPGDADGRAQVSGGKSGAAEREICRFSSIGRAADL